MARVAGQVTVQATVTQVWPLIVALDDFPDVPVTVTENFHGPVAAGQRVLLAREGQRFVVVGNPAGVTQIVEDTAEAKQEAGEAKQEAGEAKLEAAEATTASQEAIDEAYAATTAVQLVDQKADGIQSDLDDVSGAVFEVREELLPPMQDAITAANTQLSEHTQEIQDQHNDLVALREAALTGTTVEYAVGTSETIPPTSGWSTATPTRTPGSFIWFRTVVERGETSTTTNPALLTGNAGAPGPKGDDGTSVTIEGSVANAAALPTGLGPDDAGKGWITDNDGHLHVWSGTGWTDAGEIRGPEGPAGADGSDGRSVTGVDVLYYVSTSRTALSGGSWDTTAPTVPAGRWLWTKTVTVYSSGSPSETNPVMISGDKGDPGDTGSTGRGISSVAEQYYLSTSMTTLTGGSWVPVPPDPVSGRYYWTRSVITYTTGTPAKTETIPKMVSGHTGADGQDGADGVSVTSVKTFFLRAASRPPHPSGNPPNGGWTEEEPGYLFGLGLWRTEQVLYSSGGWSYTPPTLVGGDAALENAFEARREFVTYEWAGNPHVSESIEKMNGREVRRNYIINPSFELGIAGWDASGTTGEVTRTTGFQGQMWDPSQGGQGNAWIPYSDNGRADTRIVQWRAGSTATTDCYLITAPAYYVPVTPGEWIAVGGLLATEASDEYQIDIVAQFRAGGAQVSSHSDYSSAKFYSGRLVRKVLQVPEGAETVRLVLWVRRSGGLPANSRSWADAIALYKAPSEAEAWAQLSLGYFDGDTPSGAGDERITNAQLSANRRNQIIPALTGPTGSVHPETGEPLTKGDTWWQKDTLGAGGVVIGEWHWDGNGWRSATIGHEVISSVDVNDLNVYGTGQIRNAVMEKLWADGIGTNVLAVTDNLVVGDDITIGEGAVKAPHIAVDALDYKVAVGMHHRAAEIVGGEIISTAEPDNPAAANIMLRDARLSVNQPTIDGPQTTTSLGKTDEDDQLALYELGNTNPGVLLSASGHGGVSGQFSVGERLTVAGRNILNELDAGSGRVLVRARNTGNSGKAGASALGLVRMNVDMETGRLYDVTLNGVAYGPHGSQIVIELRQVSGGGQAMYNSPVVARYYVPTNASGVAADVTLTAHTSGNGPQSLLWTITGTASSPAWMAGASVMPWEARVIDMGVNQFAGSVSWGGAGGTPAETMPPQPPDEKQRIVKIYQATAVRSWRGSGTISGQLGHGYWGGFQRYSQILFPSTVTTDLSGASNISAELLLANQHTWNRRSMTVRILPSTNTSLRSSPLTTTGQAVTWEHGDRSYHPISGWAASHRSINLGGGAGTGTGTYGYFSDRLQDCLLRLTYDK